MGPAGRFGLCLVLSALPRTALGDPELCPPGYQPPPGPHDYFINPICDDINECTQSPPPCGPNQSCNNTQGSFHCYCNPGYAPAPPTGPPPGDPPSNNTTPPPPPQPPRINCLDVDECAEGGGARCEGGELCFNTPGSYECHCPPGYGGSPPHGCTPMTVPPQLCPDEESCWLEEKLSHLHGLLRGGGDPHHILKELVATLEAGLELWGGERDPPRRHRGVTALLAATEGLLRGVGGALLPPPALAHLVSNHTGGPAPGRAPEPPPPPGPLRLGVPGVELEVPREVAEDSDTGLALVALLSQGGLGRVLEGAPPVRWGGWEDLTPPPPPPSKGGRPSYRLLSPVATALVARPHPHPPPGTPEVTLRFQHPPPDPKLGGRVLCAFWNPWERLWATEGCRVVAVSPPIPGTPPGTPPGTLTPPPPPPPLPPNITTTCACDHLTSFAVLLAFYELEEDWVLDVVTRVGLGVSVVSLVVAAATFLFCRALKGLRTTLHLHLSLSLLVAHATFLVGIDRTQQPTVCAVVAGLLHFSFLAAFCWMGLEGLHLHVLLVRVFVPSWLRLRHLLLLGYGPPALLLTIAAAAFPGGYGTPRYCWLSLERGFRWSFQAPVCLIIALNALVLVVTIWKLVQKFNDVNPDVGHLRKMRVLVATATGQLCLLGTGWALGLGLGGSLPRPGGGGGEGGPSPLPLLFCALNAAQGLFILLCHCLAHPKVREAYRACLCPGSKPYSEFSSNTSNTRLSRLQTYT